MSPGFRRPFGIASAKWCLGLCPVTPTASAATGPLNTFSPRCQQSTNQIKGQHRGPPLSLSVLPNAHKIAMASPTTATNHDLDRKGIRTGSPSISSSSRDGFSNVVDHLAPGVTDASPPHIPKRNANDKIINVQPLRKDEMQVRPSPP